MLSWFGEQGARCTEILQHFSGSNFRLKAFSFHLYWNLVRTHNPRLSLPFQLLLTKRNTFFIGIKQKHTPGTEVLWTIFVFNTGCLLTFSICFIWCHYFKMLIKTHKLLSWPQMGCQLKFEKYCLEQYWSHRYPFLDMKPSWKLAKICTNMIAHADRLIFLKHGWKCFSAAALLTWAFLMICWHWCSHLPEVQKLFLKPAC